MRIDYHKGLDNPELIALCLGCENDNCDRVCGAYAEKWLEIYMPDVHRKKHEHKKVPMGEAVFVGKRGNTLLYSDGKEVHTIEEWAKIVGISYIGMWKRFKHGNPRPFEPPEGIPARRGRVKPITAFGRTMPRKDWAKETGIPPNIITTRITAYGWSAEDAVSTPIRRTYGKAEVSAENKSVDGTGSATA